MSYNFLIENIKFKYGDNHKIIKGVLYQFTELDTFELEIIKLVENIYQYFQQKQTVKLYSNNFIATIIIYLYNSYIIVYNLPDILNKSTYKSKPSLHILYNEAVAQLISLVFLTESIDIWDHTLHKKYKLNQKLVDKIMSGNFEILLNNQLNPSKDIINILKDKHKEPDKLKEIFNKDIDEQKKKLREKTIKLCVNFYKVLLNLSDNDINFVDK